MLTTTVTLVLEEKIQAQKVTPPESPEPNLDFCLFDFKPQGYPENPGLHGQRTGQGPGTSQGSCSSGPGLHFVSGDRLRGSACIGGPDLFENLIESCPLFLE